MFSDVVETVKKAVRILAEDRWKFCWAVGLCIAAGGVELLGVGTLYPFLSLISRPELVKTNTLLAGVYNYFGFTDIRAFLLLSGCFALVSFAAANLFLLYKNAYLVKYCIAQMARVSTCLLESYLHKPMSFYIQANSGAMTKDVIEQSDVFTNSVLLSVMTTVSEGIILSVLTLLLIYLDPAVSLLVIVFIGATLATLLALTKSRINHIGRSSDEANAARFSFVISALQAIKEIKTFAKERAFVKMFSALAGKLAALYSKVLLLQLLPSFLMQLIASSTVILIAMYYIMRGAELANIVPMLIMYGVVGFRVMPSLTKLANAVTALRQNRSIVENVCTLLFEKRLESRPSSATQEVIKDVPVIEFRKIGFRYADGKTVLKDVTFCVEPRTLVGLVGPSGAGKTTVADLMVGLLAPGKGEILLNGVPLREFSREALAHGLAYVHQSALILDKSIAENIAFGIPAGEIDWDKIRKVVKLSHLDTVVQEKADRFHAEVGERGGKLSGGQRQRLGIARALYVEPRVLVLDESTNALDAATESAVIDTLLELKKSMTVLVIAHSRSLISRCERILMLDHGTIVADGAFDSLMASSPQFASFMANTR
jgi:ABC-type multidrug transport system fused ATPase/permease subunit